MDVYHITQFINRGVLAHQNADLLDDIGRVGSVGVTTQYETWGLMR